MKLREVVDMMWNCALVACIGFMMPAHLMLEGTIAFIEDEWLFDYIETLR